MTSTYEVAILILLALLFYIVVFVLSVIRIIDAIRDKPKSIAPKVEPFVTSSNPALSNEFTAGNDDESVIVNPKSPQLVAWEEEQAVNKINLKPQ
jgi:hypothetical protein